MSPVSIKLGIIASTMNTQHLSPYIANVVPGLEELATRELQNQLSGSRIDHVIKLFDERGVIIMVHYSGPPAQLLQLRITEDVFALITELRNIPPTRSALHIIRSTVNQSKLINQALSIKNKLSPKHRRKTTFRIVMRKSGDHAFRRVDAQKAIERGLVQRFPDWTPVNSDAHIEVWANLVEHYFVAGLRLSDDTMRHRSYKRANIPASLKPTIAYAMVLLSEPRDDDIFLDPMCGAGTILIERAQSGRYKLIIGGDINPQAVDATLTNVGPKYKPIEIKCWDARKLSVSDKSVTNIVTNMPFGNQVGKKEDLHKLYPELIREWVRVLIPGGRMVLLTSETRLLRHIIKQYNQLRLMSNIKIMVRGYPATIHVIQS